VPPTTQSHFKVKVTLKSKLTFLLFVLNIANMCP